MKTQYDIGVVAGDDGEARYTPMTLAGERMFSVEFETANEVVAFMDRMASNLSASSEKEDSTRETLNDRGQRYGDFAEHAAIAQELQRTIHSRGGWYRLPDPQRQALTTISDKIARILNGDPNYIDSWRDIAGYAQLVVDQLQNMDGATDAVVTVKTRRNGEWI